MSVGGRGAVGAGDAVGGMGRGAVEEGEAGGAEGGRVEAEDAGGAEAAEDA